MYLICQSLFNITCIMHYGIEINIHRYIHFKWCPCLAIYTEGSGGQNITSHTPKTRRPWTWTLHLMAAVEMVTETLHICSIITILRHMRRSANKPERIFTIIASKVPHKCVNSAPDSPKSNSIWLFEQPFSNCRLFRDTCTKWTPYEVKGTRYSCY